MALRLRKDVQKASYYVWFLGAQEAKELRGSRVLMSTIPRIISRSKEQEPLKVTLQISHKGLKIIQGSTKHFIPHNAITDAVQSDDIVAVVLLLYNPATKCPLHVHAYRCDSESTAKSLHEQLQILINRPENQKRFAELETRLGKVLPPLQTEPMTPASLVTNKSKHFEVSPRRFDSSLGSDTGTSTRESECSEEQHSPTGPLSPVVDRPTQLYDSLAAELRAKLNGNGPPLLLPPRDYDTVHRSQGNLAAIELRRCRNTCIVGGDKPITTKQGVISSRGSSGIGSDLAPSPERQDAQSSSDEEWANHNDPVIAFPTNTSRRNSKSKGQYIEEPPHRYRDNPPSYIYPKEPIVHNEIKKFQRSISREEEKSHKSSNSNEEEVKPVITKQSSRDRFHYPIKNEHEDFREPPRQYNEVIMKRSPPVLAKYSSKFEERPAFNAQLNRENSARYKELDEIDSRKSYKKSPQQSPPKFSPKNREFYEREREYHHENLTDRQKYRESIEKQLYQDSSPSPPSVRHVMYRGEPNSPPRAVRDYSPDKNKSFIRPTKHAEQRFSYSNREFYEENQAKHKIETTEKTRPRYHEVSPPHKSYNHNDYVDRNPYREPESIPYRESIEKMMKSPVMRYKSFEDPRFTQQSFDKYDNGVQNHVKYKTPIVEKRYESSPSPPIVERERHRVEIVPRRDEIPRHRDEIPRHRDEIKNYREEMPKYPTNRRPEKEKKVHLEPMTPDSTMKKVSPKDRFQDAKEKFQAMDRVRLSEQKKVVSVRRSEPLRDEYSPQSYSSQSQNISGWSSEDDLPTRFNEYRELPQNQRYPGLDKYHQVPTLERNHHRIAPAKSLSNLTKGYRHSYAEPIKYCGRVGLAAVNPY